MLKFILLICIPYILFGNEIFGTVVKLKGKPLADAVVVHMGDTLYSEQTIVTDAHSKLVIKQKNDNTIVVGKNAQLVLNNKEFVTQKEGNVFFDIAHKALSMTPHFKIKLKTATIGIRGTNFVVQSDASEDAVFLRRGKLEFLANKEKFALYTKRQTDEFEKFKNQFKTYKKEIMNDFNDYKNKQNFAFEAYKKQFSIEKDTIVVFEGGKVYKEKISSQKIQHYFDEFDSFIKE